MSLIDVLKECETKKVSLHVDNGILKYVAPRGTMTKSFLEVIRRHKTEIISILTSKKDELVRSITSIRDGHMTNGLFTQKYMILMEAHRKRVIDAKTKDEGLGFLLDCWEWGKEHPN